MWIWQVQMWPLYHSHVQGLPFKEFSRRARTITLLKAHLETSRRVTCSSLWKFKLPHALQFCMATTLMTIPHKPFRRPILGSPEIFLRQKLSCVIVQSIKQTYSVQLCKLLCFVELGRVSNVAVLLTSLLISLRIFGLSSMLLNNVPITQHFSPADISNSFLIFALEPVIKGIKIKITYSGNLLIWNHRIWLW